MPDSPNKLSQFWQELKRRKVVRVITVYAAAAFVILELLSIIIEPLRLPDWTLQFAIVFLCIGFIIAVILSWIYDVKPEGGIVKTKPAHKVKKEDISVSSNSWKIASYISFVVIVGLIVLNIIPRTGNKEILDKSIAVLPLDYLSEDPDKEYLANGVLDAITGHLSMIEGLRVMPRTSVEQYRENKKSAKQIGEELGVSYLIEGSFLMIEDQVKLTIQLVVANEGDHVFYKEYDRNYEDIFIVQSEVAQTIAKEIEIAITPEEKLRIEKKPTANLTAYDFFQKGNEEHFKHLSDRSNRNALDRAEILYLKALDYDSAYVDAYWTLALLNLHRFEMNHSDNCLDSALILANIALSYDSHSANAYVVKGWYNLHNNRSDQANEEFDKALRYDPNSGVAYDGKGWLNRSNNNFVEAIDNIQKAVSYIRGSSLPYALRVLGTIYNYAGFKEKYQYYLKEALILDDDSIELYSGFAVSELYNGNFPEAIQSGLKGFYIDSLNTSILSILGISYLYDGQIEESSKYYKKYVERKQPNTQFEKNEMALIGYCYWQEGDKKEADYYFNEQMKSSQDFIKTNSLFRLESAYYNLATLYAFKGELDKAFENLRIINQKPRMSSWLATTFKYDPLFNSIRDEPEFQQIVHDVEAKYKAEHERVMLWLEENVVNK